MGKTSSIQQRTVGMGGSFAFLEPVRLFCVALARTVLTRIFLSIYFSVKGLRATLKADPGLSGEQMGTRFVPTRCMEAAVVVRPHIAASIYK